MFITGKGKIGMHVVLVTVILLLSWWEIQDIYQPDSLLLPVLKSSTITLFAIYLNIYVLVPKLLFRQWNLLYLLVVIYIVIGVSLIEIALNDLLPIHYSNKIRELFGKINIPSMLIVGTSVFSIFILIISSSVVVLFYRWINLEREFNRLNETQLNMELGLFKQQVNYGSVSEMLHYAGEQTFHNSQKASETINRIGDLLRDHLYNSSEDIPISNIGKTIPDKLVRITNLLSEPRSRILTHLIYILTCVAYALYCVTLFKFFIPETTPLILLFAVFLVIDILPAYLNVYLLMPRFLYEQKHTLYILTLLGLLFLIILSLLGIKAVLNEYYQCGQFIGIIQSLKVIISLSIAGPMILALFKQWGLRESQFSQLKQITQQAELEYLKNQINPHFLFNSLNNMNVLIKTDLKSASEMITRLKNMLDYLLLRSSETEAKLIDEISFLNDYLRMEESRRDRFEFHIITEGDLRGVKVPPLLFIPFVENAVKHNLGNDYLPYVHLSFSIVSNKLEFSCINSKPIDPIIDDSIGGIGLSNVERRLELLFHKDYLLKRDVLNDTYEVKLLIPFNIQTDELHNC